MHPTKQRLLDAGQNMLLERGYNDLGLRDILGETETPKGSFYHHFGSKEDFALQVVDAYMVAVHGGLDACLLDAAVPPLQRIRNFFEATRDKYSYDGHLGCMLGGLGQELAGVSPGFSRKIDECFQMIGGRLTICFAEAQQAGDLPQSANPEQLGKLLVNCWEGAALRSRLRRSSEPLEEMLDFFFGTLLPT